MLTSPLSTDLLIGGRWTPGATGKTFEVTDPATGAVVGSAADACAEDVSRAVDAADAALTPWRRSSANYRAQLMRRAAASIRDRMPEIARVMTAEQGKPLAEAIGEVEYAASFFDWFAGEAERVYGQTIPAMDAANRVLVLPQAVGVTVAITPWNFPVALLARKLAPAMAAGCTSVLKPAEATPLSAVLLIEAIQHADVPEGVINLITTNDAPAFSRVVFGDDRVRKLSFTGSTAVGKELVRMSADQVKRLSLELGGHAPYIVFDDAEIDRAVDGIIASKFRNAGQTCVCANRIFAQRNIYGEIVERLTDRVADLVVGRGDTPGVDIGPLIDSRATEKAHAHVSDAVAHGARLLTGGHHLIEGDLARGSFYAPTVLADVTPQMLISREETFGPVAGLTPFDTEEEAIALANDSTYGLSAYFHTHDYARLLRVAERLDYGVVGVNAGIISAPNVPFGGMKESGYGREGGPLGIEEYLEHKYVLIANVN
jgi:succinate-semialdehyde dehydrogenase/glutarate-semialdehyde dehydrogenase